jgi:nucleoside-diphosphate-sugar epimerase
MKLLLTGASGVLGSHLTRELLQDGHQVYALVHRKALGEGPVVCIQGDVTLPRFGIQGEFPKLDAIVNAAGLVSFNNRERPALQRVNVDGAWNAANTASCLGIPLLHISTAYVCGDHKGIFEATDLELGQHHRNEYERSKYQAEQEIREWKKHHLSWTIFRPSILVGDSKVSGIPPLHGLYLGVRGVYLTKRWLERKFALPALDPELRLRADPHATINIIPVDIAARQIADLVLKSEPGTYPIVNTQPPTIAQICAGAGAALGAKIIPCLSFEPNPGERMLERLVRDLLPYLQGEPVFAANPSCPSPAAQVIPPGFVEQTARLFLLNHSGQKR